MRAVNLLPRDAPVKSFEAKRGVAFGAGGGAALVTVALTALMLGAGGSITEKQGTLDSLNAELATLPAGKAPDPNIEKDAALATELTNRIGALSAALGTRVAWDGVLRQISQVLPEDVWLTSLATNTAKIDPANPNAPLGPNGISITGSTYSQSGVARLLSRLTVAPLLGNVTLVSSTTQDSGATRLVQFVISADVRSAGAAS